VYDVNTKKITQPITELVMLADFSPDGSKLAYVRNNNLFVFDFASKKEIQVTHKELEEIQENNIIIPNIAVKNQLINSIENQPYIIRYKNESPKLIDKIVSINSKITDKYNYLNSVDFSSVLHLDELEMENPIKAIHLIAETTDYFQHHTSFGYIITQNLIDRLETFLYENKGDFWRLLNYRPIKGDILNDRSVLEIDNIISSLNKWLLERKQVEYNLETETYLKLKEERNILVIKLICELKTKNVKDDFVFNLLRNEDFKDIVKEDFSRLSEDQYRKFQSFRAYYNKLLKLVSAQANINKNLTSHIARHSYASLMLELGENINLFDLMTSLGHQRLATTQTYIQRLSNKKIDQLNRVISDSLNTGINLNL
jgi:hypothetical protein